MQTGELQRGQLTIRLAFPHEGQYFTPFSITVPSGRAIINPHSVHRVIVPPLMKNEVRDAGSLKVIDYRRLTTNPPLFPLYTMRNDKSTAPVWYAAHHFCA
jgi:hypothetical protein